MNMSALTQRRFAASNLPQRQMLLRLCVIAALCLPALAAAKELVVSQVVALSGWPRRGARVFGGAGNAAGRNVVPADCA